MVIAKPFIKTTCLCGKIFTQPDVKYKHKYCSRHCVGVYINKLRLKNINLGRKHTLKQRLKRSKWAKKNIKHGITSLNWKGGIVLNGNYYMININSKYKLYHRYLFEKYYDTKIPIDYIIHHIDCNNYNNNINNLQCMSTQNHNKLHWDIRKGDY